MTPNKSMEISVNLKETMKNDMLQCIKPIFPFKAIDLYNSEVSTHHRDRIFNTENTLYTMVITALHEDKSLQNSVDIFTEIFARNQSSARSIIDAENKKIEIKNKQNSKPQRGRPRTKKLKLPISKTKDISTNTAAYSKARGRIDQALIDKVFNDSTDFSTIDCTKTWYDRLVFNTDGTYFQMQDTPKIGEKYRTQKNKDGTLQGYPQGLLQVLTQHGTGLISNYKIAGRNESELSVMSSMLNDVPKGSLILADDLYNCYAFICLAKDNNLDVIVPDKKKRKFEIVKEIAPGDQIILLRKNPKAKILADKQILPDTLLLRRISYKDPDHPEENRVLLTSIFDESIERHEFIHQFTMRWDVEITIREIKTIMGINILRAKSEEMVFREMGVALLAYNLLRKIVSLSAKETIFSPERDIFQKLYSLDKTQLVDRKGRLYSRWSPGRPALYNSKAENSTHTSETGKELSKKN